MAEAVLGRTHEVRPKEQVQRIAHINPRDAPGHLERRSELVRARRTLRKRLAEREATEGKRE